MPRQNARTYRRLPAPWPIKCESLEPAGTGQSLVATSAANVSAGGVALTSQQVFPVGTRVRIEILVPPIHRTIRAQGVVLRCAPSREGKSCELGIQFDQIDPPDRIALNEAIERFYGGQGRGEGSR